MTRVTRYRVSYLVLLALLAGGAYLAIRSSGNSQTAIGVALLLLLTPGRLQGLILRPLFRGQRYLARGKAGDATQEFEELLELLDRQPWRKWALWLGWSLYTPSAKAMALNNLGVAHADLGNLESARGAWENALAIDPLYPLPYSNLAALAAEGGNGEQAISLLARAEQLGYTGRLLDQATHRVQQLLAVVESRGPSV